MNHVSRAALLIALSLLSIATVPIHAAQQDAAAERAAIANQRIQAEVEMRRRAEEAAREAEQQATAEQSNQQVAPQTSPQTRLAATTPVADSVKSRADMSRTLQQIRTLGELRDAGYVTDDEFERIKARILQGAL